MCVCVQVGVWRQEMDTGHLPLLLSVLYSWDNVSSCIYILAHFRQKRKFHFLSVLELQAHTTTSSFWWECWRYELWSSLLPALMSTEPSHWLIYYVSGNVITYFLINEGWIRLSSLGQWCDLSSLMLVNMVCYIDSFPSEEPCKPGKQRLGWKI